MTRILLQSDQPILSIGMEYLFSSVEGLRLERTCSRPADLASVMADQEPDILLLDLTPEVSIDFLAELRSSAPNCRVVLWVNEISTEMAFQALGLGVRGIVRKCLPPASLVESLRKVQAGELAYDKELTDSFFAARRVVLTRRESQLVSLISQGLRNKEIATALQISEGTVKVYLQRLFAKVGVKDRLELALFGLKNFASARSVGAESSRLSEPAPAGIRSVVITPPANPAGSAQRVYF